MIRSLKTALGLCVLAALLTGAIGATSASAATSGHFTSESAQTKLDITGATGTSHEATLSIFGVAISCHQFTYTGSNLTVTTTQTITASASLTNCTTGGSAATVNMNGCDLSFTSRTTGHATTHFICPVGKKAEVITSNGTMKFGTQTPTTGGVTFTAITMGTKPALTANITVEGIHAECHGACQIFGTSNTAGKLTGSATVQGTDATTGAATGIAAT
jgi:hypothetical protein